MDDVVMMTDEERIHDLDFSIYNKETGDKVERSV
jgi:hypothetical protein